MKRLIDLFLSFISIIILFVPMLLVAFLVKFTSEGPVLYWSQRIGKDNNIFLMPKFRTMLVEAPTIATHLMINPTHYLTSVGSFLRKTSLDELPQLWCILMGKMTIVGPRPALFNQYDLIELRTQKQIHTLIPGLTGWAQVNGRDDLSVHQKVELDAEYLRYQSLWFDLKIIWYTFVRVIRCDGVLH